MPQPRRGKRLQTAVTVPREAGSRKHRGAASAPSRAPAGTSVSPVGGRVGVGVGDGAPRRWGRLDGARQRLTSLLVRNADTAVTRTAVAPGPAGSPTIYDVARLAGVSIASVSRVLNQRGRPRLETRERVLDAVRDLGFVRDGAARALSSGLKEVVGVAFRRGEDAGFEDEDESPLFDEVVNRGIEASARAVGFDVLISTVSTEDAAIRLPALARKVDGLILHDSLLAPAALARLAEHVPVVTLASRPVAGAVNVRCDNVGGMRALVRHLVSDHGYRSLAYLSGHTDSPDNLARARALRVVARAAGVEVISGPSWRGDYSAVGAARAISSLLEGGARLPRAIICANDQTAVGVMHALGRHGLRVPADVAVTGFDDVAIARHLHPPLTTVRQPIRDLGSTAFDMLHAAICGRAETAPERVLPAVLVIRESCGCHAA